MANSVSPIQYIPYDQAYGHGFEDMPRRVPDISKIRRYIDWKPRLKLEEIIQQVIDYHSASVQELAVPFKPGAYSGTRSRLNVPTSL
jgi:nucleoside-diphosphate-sugar epimerase